MLSRDYNKVVSEIHEDAKRESLMQKTSKLRKIEEKERRKELRVLKREQLESKTQIKTAKVISKVKKRNEIKDIGRSKRTKSPSD